MIFNRLRTVIITWSSGSILFSKLLLTNRNNNQQRFEMLHSHRQNAKQIQTTVHITLLLICGTCMFLNTFCNLQLQVSALDMQLRPRMVGNKKVCGGAAAGDPETSPTLLDNDERCALIILT